MRRYWKDIIGIGCISMVVAIFLARLFFPAPHLLVTQDLGRSDAWHFSFATKFALGQSLKVHELPIWRKDIGDGFPLFAEGQTGALFLPNTIAFTIFDPVTAYSLVLTLSISTLCLGMYLWSRLVGLGVIASVFAGITSGFFAYPIMQMPHITLLQGTSLMPLLIIATQLLFEIGPFPWVAFFAFFLSQQIFAGFPQATFLTILLCGWYMLWLCMGKRTYRPLAYFCFAVLLGIGGGAAQLLPSWEFLRYSAYPQGFALQKAGFFSFPLVDLLTLLNPFAIGNPKTGTYTNAMLMEGNIAWENTIYMGLLPLGLLIYGVMKKSYRPLVQFLWLTALGSLLLAWGKYSPLYILYGLWPFNLFRVPSRFIWITAVCLILLAAHSLDQIAVRTKSRLVAGGIIILVIFHVAQLLTTWWNYHLLVPARDWLEPPSTRSAVGSSRMLTIGENIVQQRQFVTKGWSDPAPYDVYREGMSPDSNMLWNVSQHGVYAGRFLLRPTVLDDLLNRQSMQVEETAATTSALTIKLLNMFSVKYVLSFVPLTQTGWIQKQTSTRQGITLALYENPTALPRAYVVREATTAATFESAGTMLQDPRFIIGKNVLLESHEVANIPAIQPLLHPDHTTDGDLDSRVTIGTDSHTRTVIQTHTTHNAILVLTDTNYPGWTASIEGKQTPILTANFTQRAVYLPRGDHTIEFRYAAPLIKLGLRISAVFWVIIALMVFPTSLFRRRRHQTSAWPVPHRRRSRDR